MTTFADYLQPCRACGSRNVRVEEREDEDKPIKITCLEPTCRKVTWPPKPKNEGKRRDRNPRWAKNWRLRLGGELVCTWCGIHESETRTGFDIDHIRPIEADGADEMENTMPLCRNCHTKRHADQRAVQHVHFRSAREHRRDDAA